MEADDKRSASNFLFIFSISEADNNYIVLNQDVDIEDMDNYKHLAFNGLAEIN